MYYPTQLSGFEQPPVHIDQVLEPVLHDLRQAQAGYNIENTALVTANLQGLSLNAPGDIPEPPAPKRKAAARGRTKKAAGNATIPVGTSEGIVDEPQARVTRTRGNKKRA
ncbi:hypothetical protein PHLGIDRAFT_30972 [Phlebiopsis gigantea 11061_1 CR5-6]|uniref:Uncharacterized protein n=1 Tax=Phlebiopsis gigantea (strain 11061_1 CR5-6) TaxID=745531 RepID=A0A0C3S8H5_PHLG1|nr:hypothetical protein PHLGIDRAFT_30972 [Phlebiopsis gigantea 11061_1 CR5-6]